MTGSFARSKFKLLFWPDMDIPQIDEKQMGEVFMDNRKVVLMLEILETNGNE